jgi:hypothetical protein
LFGSWVIAALFWAITVVVMLMVIGVTLGLVLRGVMPLDSAAGGATSLAAAIVATRFILTPFIAGINARTLLAAAAEGRIEGFQPSESVAQVFE